MSLTQYNKESVLIIKIEAFNKPILDNIAKYERYLNFLFKKLINPTMTLEFIGPQLLVFLESVDSYINFIKNQIKFLDKYNLSKERLKEKRLVQLFIHRAYNKNNFPTEEGGLKYKITFIQENNEEQKFYDIFNIEKINEIAEIVHPDITLTQDEDMSYNLNLISYESMLAFANNLYYYVFKFNDFEDDI